VPAVELAVECEPDGDVAVPAPVGALVEGDRIKELLIGPTVLDQLAHQLTVASEIAWTKHKWLQVSMCFGVAGISCVILAYALAVFT
jgi:hypothetical protein